MQVRVALFSYFRDGRFAEGEVELPAAAAVADLLAHLGIVPQEVGVLFVNGRSGTLKDRLRAGDRVTVIPMIGGG